MILQAIGLTQFLGDLEDVTRTDAVDVLCTQPFLIEEDTLRGVQESDQHFTDWLLVTVLYKVIKHSGMSVDVGVDLLSLCAHKLSEDLGEVATEDWVELLSAAFGSFKEG